MRYKLNFLQRFAWFLFSLIVDAAVLKYVFNEHHAFQPWVQVTAILAVYTSLRIMFSYTFRGYRVWMRNMRNEKRQTLKR